MKNLLVTQAYFERFYELRDQYRTDRETYFALELEVESQTSGSSKYTSYESFKQMKGKYLRNLLSRTKKSTKLTRFSLR